MPEPKKAEKITLGYGDRMRDGEIEHFAVLTIFAERSYSFEVPPEMLSSLDADLERVTEALTQLRRRQIRRISRSRSGWRAR